MANNFQELAKEIDRREWELANMQRTLDDCLIRLDELKNTLTPEIRSYCETFSPGSLDIIFNQDLHTLENANVLLEYLNKFSDDIYGFVKGALQ